MITWRGDDGAIEIARSLTDSERRALATRSAELAPALEPFDRARPGDQDRVAAAAAEMYGSIPSMRGADPVARVASLIGSLERQGLPTWAIERACREIQDGGFLRSDGERTWTERQWPPTDSEVAQTVRAIVRLRAAAKANAEALLGAAVRS